MRQYHYKKGTMALGPYALQHMQALASQGQIGRGHLISDDGGESWRVGAEFSEIFEATRDAMAGEPEQQASSDGLGPTAVAQWHYTCGGESGRTPVSEDELKTLIRTGQVTDTDLVWTKTLGAAWVPVAEVSLFAADLPASGSDASEPRRGGHHRRRRHKQRPRTSSKGSDEPRRFNGAGLSGFICSLIAVVLLAIPCLVWVFIAQSFFWIFNLVLPLLVIAVVGLVLSVIGLSKPARGLATAGTILGVVAVTMATMAMVGSATIRWRLAALRRGPIDSCVTDIELAKKKLQDSLTAYRGTRQRDDEDDELFELRQQRSLRQMGLDLAALVAAYDGHVTVTAGTSEFDRAFDGLTLLRKAIQDVQQTARAGNDIDLIELLETGHANADKLRLLMDTLSLYEKGAITLSQAEAKMAGR